MSDSSDRVKPTSVAAFLFLPQFGSMFRSSSHLIPVFMRTIARLFVQAELLPPTHPAAMYGDPGVEKCGFRRIMGDAWYTIRSTSATPYQWSVFCSVLLMVFVLISSVISTLYSLGSTFAGTASAQIFNSSLGSTDMANMPPITSMSPCSDQTPLCRVFPPAGSAYGDYAIGLLDKILRYGANQTGSPLQNATGALMQVYNAGILFVAACLLFWLVISIVVDIAKTGHVGGGRHNLVWAPIRIVFALGMLVPLGTSGFSSGQFVVMKIAEWGSNFGTNGWNAYLKGISSAAIVPKLPLGDDLMPLVSDYEKMWICRVAHNGYGYQAEGTDFSSKLGQQAILKADSNRPDTGQMSYSYTNQTSDNLCGRLSFPTANDPSLISTANSASADPVTKAAAQIKVAVAQAWEGLFVSGYSQGGNSMSDNGLTVATYANDFACDFVSQHIWGTVGGSSGPDVLSLNCGGGGNSNGSYGKCSQGQPGSGTYPDMTCVDDYSNEMNTATMTGYIGSSIYTAAQSAVNQYFGSISAAQLFGSRGWADMATFFLRITQMTNSVSSTLSIPVSITIPSNLDSGDQQATKVLEVMTKYADWWNTVPKGQPAPAASVYCTNTGDVGGSGAAGSSNNCATRAHHSSGMASWGHFTPAKQSSGNNSRVGGGEMTQNTQNTHAAASGLADKPDDMVWEMIKPIVDDFTGKSVLGIDDETSADIVNKYPLQVLADAGHLLLDIGMGGILAVTTAEIVVGAASWGDAIGPTITTSLLMQLVNSLLDVMLMCSFILTFYLPLVPFIRVSHAVLVWMMTVFEAVMLVPISCLSFLDTEKEGMYAKHPFINWLDVLVRPILTVIGYVGAVIIFDAFFGYFHVAFISATAAAGIGLDGMKDFFGMIANTVIFTFIMYTSCNTCFKMISIIPDAFFRWLPGGQASGATHIDAPDASGAVGKLAGAMGQSSMAGASGMKSYNDQQAMLGQGSRKATKKREKAAKEKNESGGTSEGS